MFYFKFHIGDYRRETSHLTLLEHGVYMTLMSTYYTNEHPLPADEKQLFRLAGARTDEEKEAVINVVNEFFKQMGSEWVHSRIDFELKKYQSRAETNRENGKKGGKNNGKSKNKANNTPIADNFEQMGSQSGSKHEATDEQTDPLTNKPINPLTHNINIVFNFWKEVFSKSDRTVLKGKRETSISGRLKEGYTVDEIKQAILNVSVSEYHITGGHTDIELICRNQINLDKYIAMGGFKNQASQIEQPQQQIESEWVEF